MDIEEKLESLPPSPGVYLMKGKEGIIYIGKAKNLRSRVRSYFLGKGDTRYAVRYLARKVEDLDYIVTGNEKEALILEDTLLKKHRPRYNIRLKDDKTYVSIKITTNEKFPRIIVTRRIRKDGARYFGPYASARSVRDTVKFLRRIFPLCVCTPHEFRNRVRPCLDYQLGICSAPAVGLIKEGDYRELVEGAVMFLEGRNRQLIKRLKNRMKEASKAQDYEKAAKIRDQIASIEATLEEQKVVSPLVKDQDVFSMAKEDKSIVIQALFIRGGRLTGARDFPFHHVGLPDGEVFSSFVSQFYRGEKYIPDEVLLSVPVEDAPVITEWLTDKRGKKVAIQSPRRGHKLKLVRMAEANAREALTKKKGAVSGMDKVIGELQTRLHLKGPPKLIEAFDISNIGGKQAVGAMVTFAEGRPDKTRYRLYRIRTAEGPDDYAMMYEVLLRRYGKPGAPPPPDLVLVDGGKGQLNIALRVMEELKIKGLLIAALAKEKAEAGVALKGERVYLPKVKDPIWLKEGSGADLLLRRIRDEVHRFAVRYHRKLRGKTIASALDRIPGIGDKRKSMLFKRFGDIKGIAKADIEELTKIPGITKKLAHAIKDGLRVMDPGVTTGLFKREPIKLLKPL
jgi:excinuclease ABC subunit C